jgi:hypothetical protein
VRRKLALLVIALLPAALGFFAWQMYRIGWLTDSIIYLRASLGLLLLIGWHSSFSTHRHLGNFLSFL